MKVKILPLLVFWTLSAFVTATAQISITPNPITFISNDFDLSDEWVEAVAHADMTNEYSSQVQVKWEAQLLDAPSTWLLKICDKNTCYGDNVSSNIDPSIGLNEPVVLAPGEIGLLDTHVLPKGTPGCGKVVIKVSLVSDPSTILETANYTYEINVNGDCEAVSLSDLTVQSPSIYPNPVQNEFFLRNPQQQVKTMRLFNLMGKEVQQFQVVENRAYDLSKLNQGIYFMQLLDSRNKIIKTVRINKQ